MYGYRQEKIDVGHLSCNYIQGISRRVTVLNLILYPSKELCHDILSHFGIVQN